MGMIKDLWDIGKEILAVSDTLKLAKKEKKQSLSVLMAHIGDIMNDTSQKLSKNIYPAGNCEQLEVFSKVLYDELEEVIGENKAGGISNKLMQAHRVELLHDDLTSGKINPGELKMLDEAAGHFTAVSKLLLL